MTRCAARLSVVPEGDVLSVQAVYGVTQVSCMSLVMPLPTHGFDLLDWLQCFC